MDVANLLDGILLRGMYSYKIIWFFFPFSFDSVEIRTWPSLNGYCLKRFITFKGKKSSSVENPVRKLPQYSINLIK